jgi:hypothetical protein
MPAFDEPGDLALNEDETDFVLGSGASVLSQQIAMGFLILPGTWKFDRSQGFPLFETAFVTTFRLPFLKQIVRKYLETFADVKRVIDVDIIPIRDDLDRVVANVIFSVETTFGVLDQTDIFMPLFTEL